ncbi:MAG: hypothetical protein KF687_05265 [Cyclobacteriaceae bacterium]|nr:hypothetical protein [Cyclobacteriaceae bacterium]
MRKSDGLVIFEQLFNIMMKRLLFLCLLSLSGSLYAQSSQDFMIGGALDFLKTDNQDLFGKAQIGFEANYFVIRKFTVTAGVDIWTNRDASFVFGSRWYLADKFFTRFRGLIGENDFSIGAGGAIPFQNNWRFEVMGDFYFKGDFAVRGGVAYIIGK